MGYTYVISDVHGQLKCFESILDKINLQPDDRLYVLGDVIDFGYFGIEILKRIMAMPNVEMLLGDHEFMMLNALGVPYDGIKRIISDCVKQWHGNGGYITSLTFDSQPERVKTDIIDYLKSRPLSIDIEVMSTKHRLVHSVDKVFYERYKSKYASEAEFSVFDREALDDMNMSDTNYVFGHVMNGTCGKRPREIWYKGHMIAIDCGCAVVPNTMEQQVLGLLGGRLGCMRLDDMIRFYSHDHPKDYFSAATIKPNPRLIERIKKKFPIIISSDD